MIATKVTAARALYASRASDEQVCNLQDRAVLQARAAACTTSLLTRACRQLPATQHRMFKDCRHGGRQHGHTTTRLAGIRKAEAPPRPALRTTAQQLDALRKQVGIVRYATVASGCQVALRMRSMCSSERADTENCTCKACHMQRHDAAL